VFIELQESPVFTGSTTADISTGDWSFSVIVSTPADGDYTAGAAAVDAAGNAGFTEDITFVFDTTDPSVSIDTIPSPTNTFPTTISGVTDELGASVLVEVVDSLSNIVSTGSTTSDISTGAWTVTISPTGSPISEDSYFVFADVTDSAGNLGGDSTSFTFDVSSPSVNIDPIIPGITNIFPTSFSGTTEEGATVDVFIDVVLPGTSTPVPVFSGAAIVITVTETTTWTFDTTGITTPADGTYSVLVEATDAALNEGSTSASFVFDTTDPSVSIDEITSPTNTFPTTISGTAEAGAAVDRAGICQGV